MRYLGKDETFYILFLESLGSAKKLSVLDISLEYRAF